MTEEDSVENENGKTGFWSEPMGPSITGRQMGAALFFLVVGALFFHRLYHDWYMRRAVDQNTYMLGCHPTYGHDHPFEREICADLKWKLQD